MPRETQNLHLFLPNENELFNITTWNQNMQTLDEAYALLTDPSGSPTSVPANMISYDNSVSGMTATNLQSAVDELAGRTMDGNTYEIYVDQDMQLTIATWAHIYIILHFSDTVYNVTFVQSLPDSGIDFVWEGGIPNFQSNSTYELSFLRLDCMWFKR